MKPRTRLVIMLLTVVWLALWLAACSVAGKPSVVIMSPPSGSQYFEGEDIAVQSSATDSAGVVRVELVVDGAVVRVDPSPTAQGQPNFTLIQTWKATRRRSHNSRARVQHGRRSERSSRRFGERRAKDRASADADPNDSQRAAAPGYHRHTFAGTTNHHPIAGTASAGSEFLHEHRRVRSRCDGAGWNELGARSGVQQDLASAKYRYLYLVGLSTRFRERRSDDGKLDRRRARRPRPVPPPIYSC